MNVAAYIVWVELVVLISCSGTDCNELPDSYSSFEQAIQTIRDADFTITDGVKTDKSSWIRAAEFYSCDKQTGYFILVTDSKDYIFKDMPVEVWEGFKNADSYGKFYHARIKDRYTFELSDN